ncbi:MAG: hypothetical protein ACUVRS_02335 [Armatimonadota bacterium]
MSEFLRKLVSHIAQQLDPRMQVVTVVDTAEEESASLTPTTVQMASAEVVEPSGRIDAIWVGEPIPGKLAYFMDGMERQRLIMYFAGVPVVYGYVASAIRFRGPDRKMRTYGAPEVREALFYPKRLVNIPLEGFDVVDVEDSGGILDEHPIAMLEAARKKISDVRAQLEAQVTSRWLSEFNGTDEWLVVDGSISGDYDLYAEPNIIGVVKSHQTQYFPIDQQRKILALEAGQRSGLFIPKGRNRPDVYSWYLRLWPSDGRDAYFGLVRIEAARCDRTLKMADEISRWLLAERAPLSLPDARWDRMIYPIRDCEQFMRSIAPSKVVINSLLMRLVRMGRG